MRRCTFTPDEQCALAELAVLEGVRGPLSTRDIADLIGVSHGTVQNIQDRALEKLRKHARSGWR